MYHLREMGPSRKILHARGVGSERRKPVVRQHGSWGASGATRKNNLSMGESLFQPFQGPLFLAARMRPVYTIFQIQWFTKSYQKTRLSKKSLRKRHKFDGLGRPKRETVANFATWDARNVKQSPILRPGAPKT